MMHDTEDAPAASRLRLTVLGLCLTFLFVFPQAGAMQVQLPSATDDEGSSTESGKSQDPDHVPSLYLMEHPPAPELPDARPRSPVPLPEDRLNQAVADATEGTGFGLACTADACPNDIGPAQNSVRCNWKGRWKVTAEVVHGEGVVAQIVAACGGEPVAECVVKSVDQGGTGSCDSGLMNSGKGELSCYWHYKQGFDEFEVKGQCIDPIDPEEVVSVPATRTVNACLERSILDDPTLGFGCGLAPTP